MQGSSVCRHNRRTRHFCLCAPPAKRQKTKSPQPFRHENRPKPHNLALRNFVFRLCLCTDDFVPILLFAADIWIEEQQRRTVRINLGCSPLRGGVTPPETRARDAEQRPVRTTRTHPDALLTFAARHFSRRRTKRIQPPSLPLLIPSRVRDVRRLIRTVGHRQPGSRPVKKLPGAGSEA